MNKRIIVNGNEYEFINETSKTRTGFKHTSTLYINGTYETDTSVHYINRTWESYPYRTAMLNLIEGLLKDRYFEIEETLKMEEGWQRISKDRRETIDCIFKDNDEVQELMEVRKAL